MLNDLYKPDRVRLTTMIIGAPGSGKSEFTRQTLKEFLKRNSDEWLRIVYCCPKWEMDLGEKTLVPMHKLESHLAKNRLAVVYPNPEDTENDVDWLIMHLFDIKEANPEFKCVFICDDAQIFLSSAKQPSQMWKRLTLTGRSKDIRLVAISHGFVFSKQLEGSTSFIVQFRGLSSKLHNRDALIRYGYDPEPYVTSLADVPYSHVFYDVTKGKSTLMKPLELKGAAQASPSA